MKIQLCFCVLFADLAVQNNLADIHLDVHKYQISPLANGDLTPVRQTDSPCRIVRADLEGIDDGSAGVLHIVAAGHFQRQLGTGDIRPLVEVNVGHIVVARRVGGICVGAVRDQNDSIVGLDLSDQLG